MDYKSVVLSQVFSEDYEKGLRIDKENIKSLGKANLGRVMNYNFLVHSDKDNVNYIVRIGKVGNEFTSTCNCQEHYFYESCPHVAACFIKYRDYFYNEKDNLKMSREIMSMFSSDSKVIKKEVFFEYNLLIHRNYYGKYITLKMRVGNKRMYAMNNKFNSFMNCLEKEDGVINFGKEFTFDPKVHYLSEVNKQIINYLSTCNNRQNEIALTDRNVKYLMKLFEENNLKVNGVKVEGIREGNPFVMNLTKKDKIYELSVDLDYDLDNLTNDYKYIYYNKYIYSLRAKDAKLIGVLSVNNMSKLTFNKSDLSKFTQDILPIVKNNVIVDDKVDDIVIAKEPDVKLYFDFNKNNVECKVVFDYNGNEIKYFNNYSNVLRDSEFESSVISELVDSNFVEDGNKLIIDDLERIVDFINNKLDPLTEKYETYISEKLKQTKVVNKTNVTSTFSIGKDNIMRYDFDLGDINDSELDNIISSMRKKKKYYKLKTGDILNLEDDSLKELNSLMEDLDVSSKESSGEIPKYRAIYLDSLDYGIIKTDNLFNDFISKFNQYKNSELDFKKEEKDILRSYQLEGVKWLYNIHKCDLGGILADEMGLGKSIQTIYFFKKLLEEDKDSKFLIVCPTSLVFNWKNEFDKFAKDIKIDTFIGNKKERKSKLKNSDISVYITSYGTLREDVDIYDDINFKVCVIDEAGNIKNPLAKITKVVKGIKAESKIALTGTPIENSVIELWSIFDYVMPGFLSSQVKFNSKYKVKEYDDNTNNMLSNLNKLISPFILRRKKKDVLKDLPDKIENNIYVDLEEQQKKIYASEVKKVNQEFDEMIAKEGFTKSKFLILQLLMKLRQICIDPKLVYDNYNKVSSKMENLIKILNEVILNGHKVLLFSSFRKAIDLVEKELDKNKITYYTINGSVQAKKRAQLVDNFNNDDTNVFLITLKSGGTGLNLTSADVVIHLDLWWNPQVENQATDRAHRIGQKNTVEVVKIIARGTIEEKILELQKKKELLSDKLIESDKAGENNLSNLTEEDIKNLLSYENLDED